jgi:hypothetical protein
LGVCTYHQAKERELVVERRRHKKELEKRSVEEVTKMKKAKELYDDREEKLRERAEAEKVEIRCGFGHSQTRVCLFPPWRAGGWLSGRDRVGCMWCRPSLGAGRSVVATAIGGFLPVVSSRPRAHACRQEYEQRLAALTKELRKYQGAKARSAQGSGERSRKVPSVEVGSGCVASPFDCMEGFLPFLRDA